ncbi:Sugar phosphate exchanger 3 [Galemys pyrenaicus]|uniref:Sugar phosphate exchanger 3 n=1 Tax=Galemys pyrenaicus TaxID=202257 RepID=A0A8J6AL56_GALPY|nr:Sugar phosphate exchanger 3 [Galemys pyrenaicus]
MAWPGIFQRGALLSRFSHHHVVVFLLTFFSYSLLHASRKTFSNVKVSISKQWTPSAWNKSIELPVEIWSRNHLFPSAEEATLFLGTLDTIFLFSYAVAVLVSRVVKEAFFQGLFISGIVGDRLNLRWVLSFGMCSSALVWCSLKALADDTSPRYLAPLTLLLEAPTPFRLLLLWQVLRGLLLDCLSCQFCFPQTVQRGEWLRFYNKGLYCCLWIVNGLLQSTGWPCVVAVMGNWFGKAGRGVVFGLWSACASVGNILGACLASSVLQYGYEYAFLVTAAVQFAGGIVIFFGLLVSPEEIGLPAIEAEENVDEDSHRPLISGAENEDEYEPNYSIQEGSAVAQVKAISFHQACCLPGVIPYSLAYACLKLVNYSFFFWLPFYLSNNFGWKEAEADKLSIWYDVGGIIDPELAGRLPALELTILLVYETELLGPTGAGGTLQGFISDLLQKRAPVLALSLLLAVGSLVGYSRSPNDKSINALLMAVTGFFIGGPSNMISSAISADLGRQELVRGSSEALATVTGIVDGTGSIGAAVGQFSRVILMSFWPSHFVTSSLSSQPSLGHSVLPPDQGSSSPPLLSLPFDPSCKQLPDRLLEPLIPLQPPARVKELQRLLYTHHTRPKLVSCQFKALEVQTRSACPHPHGKSGAVSCTFTVTCVSCLVEIVPVAQGSLHRSCLALIKPDSPPSSYPIGLCAYLK